MAAGVLIGPFTPGFVANREQIAALSKVGALLLMFALGMAFSLKELARITEHALNPRADTDTAPTRQQLISG